LSRSLDLPATEGVDALAQELAKLQDNGKRRIAFLGSRHVPVVDIHLIELIARSLAEEGHNILTSGSQGVNAAVIRAVLDINPSLLTVLLPQSLDRQIPEKVLIKVLNDILVMIHPFMPHITEELWHVLQLKPDIALLSLQKWPIHESKFVDNKLDNSFQQLFEIIRLIRNLRAELGLKPSEKGPVYLISDNDVLIDFLKTLVDDIKTLTKSSEVFIFKTNAVDKNEFAKSFSGIISDLEVYLPFQDFVNIDALKERLTKDLKKVNIELENLNKRLSNNNFVDKAPKDIVDECRFKLNEGSVQKERITKKLELLN